LSERCEVSLRNLLFQSFDLRVEKILLFFFFLKLVFKMDYSRIAVLACSRWPLHCGCTPIYGSIGREVHPIAVSTYHGSTKGRLMFDTSVVDVQVFEVSVV
jgi:hypothetical protein